MHLNNFSTPRITRHPLSPARLDRITRGLRLIDVARATGISIAALSEIERGLRQPSADHARRLREFFQADAG